MSFDSRFSSRAVSRVAVLKTDEAAKRRRLLLVFSAASALVLCSIGMAKADTWVTVNPDGSVTRTETTSVASMPAQSNVRRVQDDVYPDEYEIQGPRSGAIGNTTIFSGTYFPLPQTYYSYPHPNYNIQQPGITYPIGPVIPRVTAPMITNGPGISSGPNYVLPGYGYYQPPAYYPYPVYSYPAYGVNGTYYSGPAGGGGSIYSSTTTQSSGTGLLLGNGGLNIQIGGGRRTTRSSTTVTTHR